MGQEWWSLDFKGIEIPLSTVALCQSQESIMKTNVKTKIPKLVKRTHGGAIASKVSPEEQLRRSVMACMLWEDTFYETGEQIATRIANLIKQVDPHIVANIAVDARTNQKLRHVPLLIAREMARIDTHKGLVSKLLPEIIQRADELAEFLAIYWKDGKCPISAQVKKGLAKAFGNFNEYSLAKYNRDGAVKLRDAMFLCHPKPPDVGPSTIKYRTYKDGHGKHLLRHTDSLYHKLAEGTLATPDTWEVELSAGADKCETFTRLMEQDKLGALAFLRNLRNMEQSGVSKAMVVDYSKRVNLDRVLPFRFIAAYRAVPAWQNMIEEMMLRCLESIQKLPGKTVLIVDSSGSMTQGKVSAKSDLSRLDAAGALAILVKEIAENPVIYATAGSDTARQHATMQVPARRGFELSRIFSELQLRNQIGSGGIFLKQVMDYVYQEERTADRVIVITDEVDCDTKCDPAQANAFGDSNYLINISCNENGIGYKKFTHISGWSEAIIDFIRASEYVSE